MIERCPQHNLCLRSRARSIVIIIFYGVSQNTVYNIQFARHGERARFKAHINFYYVAHCISTHPWNARLSTPCQVRRQIVPDTYKAICKHCSCGEMNIHCEQMLSRELPAICISAIATYFAIHSAQNIFICSMTLYLPAVNWQWNYYYSWFIAFVTPSRN